MSNGDFEVMPIGTMVEVRELRKLTKELIEATRQEGINIPEPIYQKIAEIERFYHWHVETYPVIV
jgi:type III secretion system FlhB-like substrate exporter